MDTIDVVRAIYGGMVVEWESDNREGAWLTIPAQKLIWIPMQATARAIKRGWLKRNIDGNYVVTKKGIKALRRWDKQYND